MWEALGSVCGGPSRVPLVREPVSRNGLLARAVRRAFASPLDPLGADGLIADLAEGLLAGEGPGGRPASPRRVDAAVIERARQFLEAAQARVVHSSALEAITALTPYALARQFPVVFATIPHPY